MADPWPALEAAILFVGWPGLILVSFFAVYRAYRFFRGLQHAVPGQLVFLMVVGWVVTLTGVALLSTLYLRIDPASAGPVVLPIFIVWSGTLIVIVYVVHRWGQEASTLDTYYGEVERMERMKTGFINHVAHELNTPLTPLRMQLAVLAKETLGPLTQRQKDALGRIDRSVQRIGRLVEEVVLASFIQSGRLNLDRESTDLRTLAWHVTESSGHPDVVVEEGPEVQVGLDRQHFGYALRGLLDQAVALRDDGAMIRVTVEAQGRQAAIRIHYPGAPLRQRDFALFADPINLEGHGHIGVDLFNAHAVIELHGGKIEAVRGDHAEIRVSMPLAGVAGPPRGPSKDAGAPKIAQRS